MGASLPPPSLQTAKKKKKREKNVLDKRVVGGRESVRMLEFGFFGFWILLWVLDGRMASSFLVPDAAGGKKSKWKKMKIGSLV
jgi:hypothetical protein